MDRDNAYTFITLFAQFQDTNVKIVDIDPANAKVELQFRNGDKRWYDFWSAAKVIEAESNG